jgi:hypothetical protein
MSSLDVLRSTLSSALKRRVDAGKEGRGPLAAKDIKIREESLHEGLLKDEALSEQAM